MDRELATFLAGMEPSVIEDVTWGERMRLRVTAYLSDAMPPRPFVTSARALVLREGSVLVAQDQDTLRHILPGGRLERGETPGAAATREIREESGWKVDGLRLLGFMHFLHLDPRLPDYPYPYPSFLQVVYAARAIAHVPDLRIDDDYVVCCDLVPVAAVLDMDLTPKERVFLDAAYRLMEVQC